MTLVQRHKLCYGLMKRHWTLILLTKSYKWCILEMERNIQKGGYFMGRPKKVVLSLDEQIEQKEAKIAELTKTLKSEKAELEKLKKEKDSAELEKLKKAIEGSSMSIDDVVAYIEGQK